MVWYSSVGHNIGPYLLERYLKLRLLFCRWLVMAPGLQRADHRIYFGFLQSPLAKGNAKQGGKGKRKWESPPPPSNKALRTTPPPKSEGKGMPQNWQSNFKGKQIYRRYQSNFCKFKDCKFAHVCAVKGCQKSIPPRSIALCSTPETARQCSARALGRCLPKPWDF